jgi:hypothetical protein
LADGSLDVGGVADVEHALDLQRLLKHALREFADRHRLAGQRVVREVALATDVVRRPPGRLPPGETPRVQKPGEVSVTIANAPDPRPLPLREQEFRDVDGFVEAVARKLVLELRRPLRQVFQSPIISFTYFAAGEPYDSIVSCSFFSSPFPCLFSQPARISFISMLPT